MLRLYYPKVVNGPVLMDQLLLAIPALAPVPGPGDTLVPVLGVETTATECWVTVPDTVPRAEVDAVVAAHNPHRPATRSLAERRAAKAAIVRERAVAEAT